MEKDQQDDSVGNSTFYQTEYLRSNPRTYMVEREKKINFLNLPLTSTCMTWYICVLTYIHTYRKQIKCDLKN